MRFGTGVEVCLVKEDKLVLVWGNLFDSEDFECLVVVDCEKELREEGNLKNFLGKIV